MKKQICLLLAAYLAMLSACSSGSKTNPDAPANTSAESVVTENEPLYTLPESSDHNGAEFVVFAADGRNELYDAEMNGDVLNDAVYQRRVDVEDYLGIKLRYEYQSSLWNEESQYVSALTSAIMADEPYSLVTGPVGFLSKLVTEGYFVNINELDIDLDNPWWVSGMRDTAEIHNKLYLLAGDFATTLYSTINVVYFNMNILKDFNLTAPYDMVRDGSWTIDNMLAMTKDVSVDLNSDGFFRLGDDRFVMLVQNNPLRSFQTSSGIDLFRKNGDTIEYIGMSERLDTLVNKMRNMFEVGEAICTYGSYEELAEVFADDRALFMPSALRVTSTLRDMKGDYGILPYPKLSESDEYRMEVPLSAVLWAVPVSSPDLRLTADFCEYYSYLSRENVTPAYYEITLKDKYSRDQNTQEMLDVIRSSVSMTFDAFFGSCFATNPFVTTEVLLTKGGEPASYIAGYESMWLTELEKLVDGYSDIDAVN